MDSSTEKILTWARTYIPDRKSDTITVSDEYIGDTSEPVNRETLYINHQAIGSVSLYIKPYAYTSIASLSVAATTDKVFMFNATLQSCTLPSTTDRSVRPAQYQKVYAAYSYSKGCAYAYSDLELATWLPLAVSYLSNNFSISYTATGTGLNTITSASTDTGIEFVSRSLAIIVRKQFIEEQKQRGLGVRFRGPMAVIDSVAQMKSYEAATQALEEGLANYATRVRINNSGSGIDIYDESVTTS